MGEHCGDVPSIMDFLARDLMMDNESPPIFMDAWQVGLE